MFKKQKKPDRGKESEDRQLEHVKERLAAAERKLRFIETSYAVMAREMRKQN